MAWRRGPLLHAKFHPHRCNVSPLRGEKPQNWPLSKLNTGSFALRAMLPVKRLTACMAHRRLPNQSVSQWGLAVRQIKMSVYRSPIQRRRWWRGSATVRHLGLLSVGHGFESCSRQRCVTTLGKLFTPMCLCHQAV